MDTFQDQLEPVVQEEPLDEGTYFCDMLTCSKASAACPLCGMKITQCFGMQRHFQSHQFLAGVHFPGEGELVSCPHCDLKVPSLDKHIGTKACKKAATRASKRHQVKANWEADQVIFHIGDPPIQKVSSFKYMDRILSANNDDLPAVAANVRCACQHWGQVAQLLIREGASSSTMSYFYKVVVQAVLLYGSATWVLSRQILLILESFHH